MINTETIPYHNKEITWLSFNERVLQEAADRSNPLGERIKFLGIYSSNLDEFFQVRVSNLKRLAMMGVQEIKSVYDDPMEVLKEVQSVYHQQRARFEKIVQDLFAEMEEHKMFLLQADQLNPEQQLFIKEYFRQKVRPNIFPIMLNSSYKMTDLKDAALYLAVELKKHRKKGEIVRYSLVEIPTEVLPRFIAMPASGDERHFMLIDEIVRYGLPAIFKVHGYDSYEAYNIKITRDSQFDLDDDISVSYLTKVEEGIQKRKQGDIIRLIYDRSMPDEMLEHFAKKIKLHKLDTVSPGGRYHYFKDFMKFPGMAGLQISETPVPLDHPEIDRRKRIMKSIRSRDILLYFPYHSFNTIIDLLREASIDPHVRSIKVTIYRVAQDSSVMNALINARKNRKEVVVLLELQARGDEAHNIHWANKLQEEGITVIFGIKGLKVHSKLCLITSIEGGHQIQYAVIGTGNLNEDTAKLYTDCCLLTSRPEITDDVDKVFKFFYMNYRRENFSHLLVSPFMFRDKMSEYIDREIHNVQKGKPAYIYLKMNNLADRQLTEKLYKASQAGVKIKIICRSRFYPVTGIPGFSENIQAISIVDKYLEHARFYLFCNGGKDLCFIGSADWQTRNIDRRVEVTCPVYSRENINMLKDIFLIQWSDNMKARWLDKDLNNSYKGREDDMIPVRSQDEVYKYLSSLSG